MALGSIEYGAVRAHPEHRSSGATRAAIVTSGVLVAMALVAVVLSSGSLPSQSLDDSVELVAVSPDQQLNQLATELMRNADSMSLEEMEKKLSDWRLDSSTLLDEPAPDSRTEMLAGLHLPAHLQSLDAPDPARLCAKKDVILSKFDQLLKKLGGEELSMNITNGKVNAQFKEALSAWLDKESEYRLTLQKSKDADDAAKYAEAQYEKYNTANTDATQAYNSLKAVNLKELQDLADEKDLITQIQLLLGILVSSPSEAKAKQTAVLQAKVDALRSMTLKAKQGKMAMMLKALKSKLIATSETDEVGAILTQMLQDIADRVDLLNKMLAKSAENKQTMEDKLVEWQLKLVDLSNAADKSKQASNAASLEREKLAGDKKAKEVEAKDENAEYKLLIVPYAKEIYIITVIKQKVVEYCAANAA